MKGRFVLVVGPSGSGKGTLIDYALPLLPEIQFVKSCKTRPFRDGEDTGSYIYLTKDEFLKKADAGEFLEWATYGGNLYGTLASEVLPGIEKGSTVLKEMEVQGARQVLLKMKRSDVFIVFINAGTWTDVEMRIRGRAPITEEELLKRKEHFDDEMSFMDDADVVIENRTGAVERAKVDFEKALRKLVEDSSEAG